MDNLNFFNTTNCDSVYVELEVNFSAQYIKYILGTEVKDFTNVSKYTITRSTNCCDPGIVTNIAPSYQFDLEMSCVTDPINVNNDSYVITIDNINGNLIQSVMLVNGTSPQITWSFTVVNNQLIIDPITIPIISTGIFSYKIILTTIEGFTYTIPISITKSGVACDGSLTINNIVYPTLPLNVSVVNRGEFASSGRLNINNNIIVELVAKRRGVLGNTIAVTGDGVNNIDYLVNQWNVNNPTNQVELVYHVGNNHIPIDRVTIPMIGGTDIIFDTQLDVNILYDQVDMTSGVYQIIICEHLVDGTINCVQNHAFIDCGTLKCKSVNKLIQCIDSNVMDFYNGLVWSNDCTEHVTYIELCAIYKILNIILMSDACYGKIDECMCNDAVITANKLYPVHYHKVNINTPCKTC